MTRPMLLLSGLAATAAFSVPPPLAGSMAICPVRTPVFAAARRCVAPVAQMGPDDNHWDASDDAALSEYMARRASAASCGQPDSVLSHMSEAYVLIFNLGKQNEGVYTLLGQAAKAAPYVLTFERIEDAERFAEQLSAEGFDQAQAIKWRTDDLSRFCTNGSFEVSLVPQVRRRHHRTRPTPRTHACAHPPTSSPAARPLRPLTHAHPRFPRALASQGALITPPTKNEFNVDAYAKQEEERAMAARAEAEGLPEFGAPDPFAAQRAYFEKLFHEGPDPDQIVE